jgi:hypothetical protein
LKAKIYGPIWERDTREGLWSIEKELSGSEDDRPPLPKICQKGPFDKDKVKALPSLNIRPVTANRFWLNMQQEGAEIFSITLDRLDCIIEDQKPDPLLLTSKLEVPSYL